MYILKKITRKNFFHKKLLFYEGESCLWKNGFSSFSERSFIFKILKKYYFVCKDKIHEIKFFYNCLAFPSDRISKHFDVVCHLHNFEKIDWKVVKIKIPYAKAKKSNVLVITWNRRRITEQNFYHKVSKPWESDFID